MSEPVLFSFKPSSFFSKKKASVRVEGSEWSEKFSLDTVGSSGTVTCPTHNMEFGVSGVVLSLPTRRPACEGRVGVCTWASDNAASEFRCFTDICSEVR